MVIFKSSGILGAESKVCGQNKIRGGGQEGAWGLPEMGAAT